MSRPNTNPNRFNIRPDGVLSKKRLGDRITDRSTCPNKIRDALNEATVLGIWLMVPITAIMHS